jgi:hypothetical protein
MQRIIPELFLDWVQTCGRAEVVPLETAFEVGLRLGCVEYRCDFEDFTPAQAREFVGLYRRRQLRFAHPGDFTVAPMLVRMTNTRQEKLPTFSLPDPEEAQRAATGASPGLGEKEKEEEEVRRGPESPGRCGYHLKY